MAKKDSIYKLFQIVSRLRQAPADYQELKHYLENVGQDEFQMATSQRTLQRDFESIRTIFGLDIVYDKSLKKYKLVENTDISNYYGYIYESLEMMNALSIGEKYRPYMYPENRGFSGIQHINTLLPAIINRQYVQYWYQKFTEDEGTMRIVQPLALKQFKLRWYLFAREGDVYKVFGLDRMRDIQVLRKKFRAADKDVRGVFQHCYGIILPDNLDEPPPKIRIEFDKEQVRYYETLPLHSTQEISYLKNNKAELRVRVYPTYDLILELLSNGATFRIISPAELREEIKSILKQALRRNK